MHYRMFAGTELKVSAIGFGVWSVATTWWGVRDLDTARNLLAEAYDLGVTFFDTADVYGNGLGETLLREVFGSRRSEIVIASKFGYDFYSHPGPRTGHSELPQDWSPAFIRRACEESLRRLGTDYIDIYQLHNPRLEAIRDPRVWETLHALQDEGKVRHLGVALGPDIGWRDEGMAAIEGGHAEMLQIIYNALERDPADELIATGRLTGVSMVARVPHASGVLDGSYDPSRHFDRSDHRSHRPVAWMQAALRAASQVPVRPGCTIGQMALLFCLSTPVVASVLPNITSSRQLREFAEASDLAPLTAEEKRAFDALWAEHRESLRQPLSDSANKPARTARPG